MKPLVSLDVFDTAIFRKVFYPTDIFNIVEDTVGNNFKALRMEAQHSAGRKVPHCNLIDIYKEIRFPFSPKEEIKAEYENCVANPYILEMYNKGEADFIFISDMYLPATVIKSMLEKCGYKNPQVYVSCELKAMKADGRLFRKVKGILNREISKHIGDNYNADILGAKRAGIEAVEYIGPAIYRKEVVTPVLNNVKLRKFLINKELSNAPIEEKIGYQFAPLALAFTQKVLNEANERQTIFFNARDSFLMYVIARWILKTKKKIKYCRFSRKSCLVADIHPNYPITDMRNHKAIRFLAIQRVKTLRDFLEVFKFTENKDFSSIFKKYKITLDSDIDLFPNKSAILEETLILLEKDIYVKVKQEKENFLKYVQGLGMKSNDIFVDLGYNGTLQGVIKSITGISLKGRYINTHSAENGNYNGCTYEKVSFLSPGFMRKHGGSILELIFTEFKGTVIGYSNEGKPMLLNESKVRRNIAKALIRGVLKGCKQLIEEGISATPKDCEKLVDRYVESPTLEEATFGNQPIFENGSNEYESMVWFNEKCIREGEIRRCYIRSYWKAAFRLLLENSKEFSDLKDKIK